MTREQIAKLLPTSPRPHMAEDVALHCKKELGPDFCTYRRVSRKAEIDYLGWPDFDNGREEAKGWIAECRCGACGGIWNSGNVRGRGIALLFGEDGIPYMGVPDEEDLDRMEVHDGKKLICPICEEKLTLIRKKALKNGRTYRIAVGSVENAGHYTAVVLWMAERFVFPDGSDSRDIYPQNAAVINETGDLMFFSFASGVWKPRKNTDDPFQKFYGTHGNVPNRTIGSWLWPDVPEQRGQTGEKTAIAQYFLFEGRWPVLYLRLWRDFPAIENIVKAGWLKPFEDSIDDEVLNSTQRELNACRQRKYLYAPNDVMILANWDAVKPHEMLGMTREEVRQGSGWGWSWQTLALWVGMVCEGIAAPGDAAFFDRCVRDYGLSAMTEWASGINEGMVCPPLEQIDRYLHRQKERNRLPLSASLELYLDYIDMLGEDHPTKVQLFPPDLRAAHDRVAASNTAANDAKFIAGFGKIRSKWGALEWSDGNICAILPRCNGDLVNEGKKLNHCVGGYGKDHVDGQIIVFIRHARRPERSWFTLNIDLRGKNWREKQLHGYGNEWAHGKHLRIPGSVRAFVDRWEAEILTPIFHKVKAAEEAEAKASKKKRGAA